MRWVLIGVVAAALVGSSAAASSAVRAQTGYIELCGPTGCARTTDEEVYAEFREYVPDPADARTPGFPPPVQPYYRLKSDALSDPAVFAGAAGQLGVYLLPATPTWNDLGPLTLAALARLRRNLRPFPAPAPASVLVDNRKVRARPIYRHLFDSFPEAYNVEQSSKPWIGVSVKWRRGTPWPAAAFTVRRGTRIMLRSDHAVRISSALAARILADAPAKKKH